MADTKSRGRTADRKRLNMSQPYEVAYAKSERASPARKALLAKAEGASAKRTTTASAGKKSGAANGGAAKRGAAAKTAKTAKKATAKSGTRAGTGRSATPRAKAGSGSASPAMRRTNADPARVQARKHATRAAPKPPKGEKTAENTAPKTMKERDAVDLLTDDHLEVSAGFKQYEKLAKQEAAAAQRRSLAQSLCDMLKTHTAIEEEIFYPAARRAGIDASLLDEADIEHASAKELIAQIEAGTPDDDRYDARVKVLGEYVTHHVVEEQTELFPKCRRTGMDLAALGGELAARKTALQGGASPDSASDVDDDGQAKSPGLLARIGDTLFAKA